MLSALIHTPSESCHPALRRGLQAGLLVASVTAAITLLISLGTARGGTGAPSSRPNILLVLCDDLGYGDLACYGHPTIRSPNVDRLAAQGMRLTACYSSAPVCSPSRAGLMTGRTPHRLGIYNWIPLESPMHLKRSEITIATLLKNAGYSTCHVGKWHLNGSLTDTTQPQPSDHGFEYWFSTQNNAIPSHRNPISFVRNGKPLGKLQGYASELVTDEAIRWLREIRAKDRPFFMFVCYHEPHEPIETDKRFSRLYPDTGKRSPYDPSTSSLAAHHGNITQMDYHFGRLLKALDEDGLTENTLVIFTSDNGPAITPMHPHGSAGPLRAKKLSLYEGGIRVPGIVRWPGHIQPGSESDVAVSGVDWLPTICSVAGVIPPADRALDGTDVSALFAGRNVVRRQPLYWHLNYASSRPKVVLREGKWKLMATLTGPDLKINANISTSDQRAFRQAELDRFELYDLEADIGETTDRWNTDHGRVRSLQARLAELYLRVRDAAPTWPEWTWPKKEGQIIRHYVKQRRQEASR